jgi:drug/metabolite transporter (DMT)-like permease
VARIFPPFYCSTCRRRNVPEGISHAKSKYICDHEQFFCLDSSRHCWIKLRITTTSILTSFAVTHDFVYFAGGTFFYTSYKGNSPSISIIFGTISVVVSSILGTVFLHDTYTAPRVVGIILILSAIAFLNFNKSEKLNKYNVFAILGGLCFGVAFTLDKSMATTISPFMYLGLMCLGVALVSIVTSYRLINKEVKRLKRLDYRPIIYSGIFGSTFNLLTFFAYRYGANVGIVDAINNTTVFVVIFLEIMILKDRSNLLRKIVSAVVALAGVVLIGLT